MGVKLTALVLMVLASPLAALFGLAALTAGTASASATDGHAIFDPSEEAVFDIPPLMLQLYAAQTAACSGLPWQVIAGIGKVESSHGRYGGATLQPDEQPGNFGERRHCGGSCWRRELLKADEKRKRPTRPWTTPTHS